MAWAAIGSASAVILVLGVIHFWKLDHEAWLQTPEGKAWQEQERERLRKREGDSTRDRWKQLYGSKTLADVAMMTGRQFEQFLGCLFARMGYRVADFHSLRHSFVTLLSKTGVHPKTAQELARHSTIDLTMNVYTHARLADLGAAVEGLPSLLPASVYCLAATGTDSAPAPESLRPACAASGTGRENAGPGKTGAVAGRIGQGEQKITEITSLESRKEDAGLHERKLPGLDSNQDKENQNLLCYRYTTG